MSFHQLQNLFSLNAVMTTSAFKPVGPRDEKDCLKPAGGVGPLKPVGGIDPK